MTKAKTVHEFARMGLDQTGWYIVCTGGGYFRPEYGDNLAALRRVFQRHLREQRCHCDEHDCGGCPK